MRNLLNFLARYNNLIIFLILEGIAVYFLATGNNYHNTRILNGIRGLTQKIEERINNIRTYLNLREINMNLAAENVALRNRINGSGKRENSLFYSKCTLMKRKNVVCTSP